MKRSAGVILHISSLPAPYGIGSLGDAAYAFIDFLCAARQSYWQVLPLGPTGYGDSPYQSFSAMAGNPYFVDLDRLSAEGLLDRFVPSAVDWGASGTRVDYEKLFLHRFDVLQTAYRAFCRDAARMTELRAYCEKNAAWLDDYTLFMAIKDAHAGRPWTEWEDALRFRDVAALTECRARLADRIGLHAFIQFQFDRQWQSLKAYANERGVQIIGDIPIYVPLDSADVWAAPEAFQLDENRMPHMVAGVPPDYFTADGQLWGNPLYDWERMRQDGYAWWKRRMAAAAERFDVVRIDHFRGLASYWCVPATEPTARIGEWVQGPGIDFVDAIKAAFPALPIIAEDLGFLTEDVHALLRAAGFPGMKVLQFAFDAREPSNYLPHVYGHNCVCYTGTHDNTTAAVWFDEAAPEDAAMAVRYLGLNREEGYHWGLIRGGMSSVADLFVAQMQDYLGLGAEARMNTPGILGNGNWQWRMADGALTDALRARMADMCRIYGRG